MSIQRTILSAAAAAICTALCVSAAHADKIIFKDVLRPNGQTRSEAAKTTDLMSCGMSKNRAVKVVLPVFEKCMKAKGWALVRYTPDGTPPVGGTLTSYADTRGDAAGHPRGTRALHADTRACRARGVANINKCLANSGWRLMARQHGPAPRHPVYAVPDPDPTWIDPDTGDRCENTGIATVCSNY